MFLLIYSERENIKVMRACCEKKKSKKYRIIQSRRENLSEVYNLLGFFYYILKYVVLTILFIRHG